MSDSLPAVRDASALAAIFEMARSFTGSFHPKDRAEVLGWIDDVQKFKSRRREIAAEEKVKRVKILIQRKRDRELGRVARLAAKTEFARLQSAEKRSQRQRDRELARVARLAAKTESDRLQSAERAEKRSQRQQQRAVREEASRVARGLERAARDAERAEVRRLRVAAERTARAERATARLQQQTMGPCCQLCREPGHTRRQCGFNPLNDEPLYVVRPCKPLWQVTLEGRGSLCDRRHQ